MKQFSPVLSVILLSMCISPSLCAGVDRFNELLESGVHLYEMRKFADSKKEFLAALSLAESEHDSAKQYSCFYNLANLAIQTRDFKEAEFDLDKLVMAPRLPGEINVITVKSLLADVYVKEGRDDKAEMLDKEILKDCGQSSNKRLICAKTHINIAALFRRKQKYAEALAAYKKAVELISLCSGSESESLLQHCLSNLGLLYLDIGDLASAEKSERTSVDLAKKIYGSNHPVTAIALNNLGSVLHRKNDVVGAEQLFKEAFAINSKFQPDNDLPRISYCNSLGCVFLDSGRLDEARKLLEEAVVLSKRQNSTMDSIQSMTNLASVYAKSGKSELAAQTFESALKLAAAQKNDTTLVARINSAKAKYMRKP